jgi:hypothetical protein
MPSLPAQPPVPRDLQVNAGFKVEINYPFGMSANEDDPPGVVTLTYSVTAQTGTGRTTTAEGQIDVPVAGDANVDGGTLMYTTAWCEAPMIQIAGAFDESTTPEKIWYSVTNAQITQVAVRNSAGQIADAVPVAAGGDGGRFLVNWCQSNTSGADLVLHGSVSAYDPLRNDDGEDHMSFDTTWQAFPNRDYLGATDQSTIGTLPAGGYNSASCCDVSVKNANLERIGELGRVHAMQPMRSLRLWAPDAASEVGHDAGLLDLLRIGETTRRRGRVNVNTLQRPVLEALFARVANRDPIAAANAVLNKRAGGVTFTNIGDFFGGVAGVSGGDVSQDDIEEAAVAKMAELVTVRQNYFTVLICAQAIRDLGDIEYDRDGDGLAEARAAYNVLDVKYDPDGKLVGYVDKILAERKVVATVYRDAVSNKLRIVQWEYVND